MPHIQRAHVTQISSAHSKHDIERSDTHRKLENRYCGPFYYAYSKTPILPSSGCTFDPDNCSQASRTLR